MLCSCQPWFSPKFPCFVLLIVDFATEAPRVTKTRALQMASLSQGRGLAGCISHHNQHQTTVLPHTCKAFWDRELGSPLQSRCQNCVSALLQLPVQANNARMPGHTRYTAIRLYTILSLPAAHAVPCRQPGVMPQHLSVKQGCAAS